VTSANVVLSAGVNPFSRRSLVAAEFLAICLMAAWTVHPDTVSPLIFWKLLQGLLLFLTGQKENKIQRVERSYGLHNSRVRCKQLND
jgi:hypothetical protein